ncbi:MAG: TrkH family potassium uptake protein [Bacteroidales bacterium]|nr:TrkH family potassium uptake protein [Bacteroidales bacterium]
MSNTLNRNMSMIYSVLHIMGLLLIFEACFMGVCFFLSWGLYLFSDDAILASNELKAMQSFIIPTLLTLGVGMGLYFPHRKKQIIVDKRSGYMVVASIWFFFSLFGALPFVLGGYTNSFTDAFFETASGFTTTGASIMTDVENLPYSIGLWRIMTEWIGGIGIVVIMLSIIPVVGGGGMTLYSAEVAGPTKNKLSPKIKETTHILLAVYIILTIIYICCYFFAGMSLFDAVCYAFTTISTGGLAPHNDSAASFSPLLQYLIILFMAMSGTNLLFFYLIVKGKVKTIRKSEEFKTYIFITIIATILVFLWIYRYDNGVEYSFRTAMFQVVSIFTSTGLLNCNYMNWNMGAITILIMLMFSGAMSGSTTGGLKLVRVMLLFKSARTNVKKSLHSNAFVPITIDKKMVNDEVVYNVFEILMLYVLTYIVIFLVFIFQNVPLDEAVVSSISMCSNIGPAYGEAGTGCFASYTPLAKWTISIVMIVARLEFITVFSIFTKAFWSR